MARPVIAPFTSENLADAGRLLAARHERQRAVEPRLPERFEDPDIAGAAVEELWERDGASGAFAVVDGHAAGFLLGTPRADDTWGPNVWVELAGHAVEDAELARDLYAAAAERWVGEGRHRHYVIAPAHDNALVDAWFNVGFGMQHVHAIRELTDEPHREYDNVQTGVAEERDVDDMVALAPLLAEHQGLSPVFSPVPPEDPEEVRAEILEDLAKPDWGNLVAEIGDRVVGNFVVVPVEVSSLHVGLGRPDGAAHLGFAVTHPDVRGEGAGLALTERTFRWARERGYDLMVTDWRATNLLSSRFWLARGFRPTFYRLYRSIP